MPDLIERSFIEWLLAEEQERQDEYRAYREYYDGIHDTSLTDRQRKYLQLKIGEEFRANYAPIVVDALAERLNVSGFQAEGGQDEILWGWWADSRMDAAQSVVHLAACRDGDSYLMVEWDEEHQRPSFTFQPALVDAEGVQVIYADERAAPKWATKRWLMRVEGKPGKQRRMNVYYPDHVEHLISDTDEQEGNWQPFAEEGHPWREPWQHRDGTGLGMPVIHFKNKDTGYNYGCSELRDVVPLQNALNKTIIDLLAAADTTAFRIFWMLGDDPSGLNVSPGSWIYSTRPPSGENGASVGYFPGESLDNLIALKDSIAIEIARVTRTPVSYFQVSGQRPAEGTLKQEEAGLVGKAKNRQLSMGNCWEDAMYLARRLWNTYGPGPEMDEEVQISTIWADCQTRNEALLIQTLKTKAELGIPRETLWQEMGYDAAQIAEMQDTEEYQQKRAMAQAGIEALTQNQRGTPPGQQGEEEQQGQPEAGNGD